MSLFIILCCNARIATAKVGLFVIWINIQRFRRRIDRLIILAKFGVDQSHVQVGGELERVELFFDFLTIFGFSLQIRLLMSYNLCVQKFSHLKVISGKVWKQIGVKFFVLSWIYGRWKLFINKLLRLIEHMYKLLINY